MSRRGTTNKFVFKKKPFFHTTSGVGEKVVFGMSGNGTLSDPFIVERSSAATTNSLGKVQVVNEVRLSKPFTFGTVGTSALGTINLQSDCTNRSNLFFIDSFTYTLNNTELTFDFLNNYSGSVQNSSSIDCFIGNSGVSSTTGYLLSAGEVIEDLDFSGTLSTIKTASGTCIVNSITA